MKEWRLWEQRGRSLLDTTKICIKFPQCGQGSVRSEDANVCTPVELQCKRFISGYDSREPLDSERSRGQ